MAATDMQHRLSSLLPSIRERREEIEEARRLPADIAEALRDTGVFRLAVPASVGGQPATTREILEIVEAVSAADGSVGWCVMIGLGSNIAAGYLDDAGSKDVFDGWNGVCAGVAAPSGAATRADGGIRLSGRWGFGSGITHTEWIWAGAMIMENGKPRMTPHGPEIIHCFFPTREAEIHDTWRVSGLSGTGSHDFSVENIFVPEHRIFSLFDPATHRPEPLFQMPSLGWFVAQAVAVSLGIARASLDELRELSQTKVPTLSQAVLADRPAAQIQIARAEAKLASARAFLHAAVDDLWQTASAGREHTVQQLANNRIACCNASEAGSEVTRIANTLGGGASIYRGSSLQRHMRDADAITHHFTVAPHVWEDAGRVFLGRKPLAPVF